MEKQQKLIENKDWDTLIILDACRYDYFEDIYKEFLEGDLRKAKSPVNTEKSFATTDWCMKTFEKNDYSDVLYFSSTPRINSFTEVDGFEANQHFSEIIDLWKTDWDTDYGTVLPERVTKSVKRRKSISDPERMIVHYLQPHCPYITYNPPVNVKNNRPETRKSIKNRLMVLIGPKLRRNLGPMNFLKLTELTGLPPVDHLQQVLREDGEDKLQHLYRENLVEVIEEVKKLVKKLDGKTVITADHGEYLGDSQYYGHSFVPEGPKVNKVPWLELKS